MICRHVYISEFVVYYLYLNCKLLVPVTIV